MKLTTDLFMKFDSKLTAGYFGKLPQYNDFIKYNAGGPEILKLDDWIQKGIKLGKKKMKEGWKHAYRNSPVYNFIYPFTDSPNLIAGTIEAGYDKSKREYPFIVFATLPFSSIKRDHYNLLPLMLSNPLEQIKNMAGNIIRIISDESASITMYTSDDDYTEKFEKYLHIPQRAFWKTTLNNPSFIKAFKTNLFNLHLNGSPGIKLFIDSTDEQFAYTLGVIMLLITNVINDHLLPAVFWSKGNIKHTIYFSFHHLGLQYYHLFDPDNTEVINLNNSLFGPTHDNSAVDMFNDEADLENLVTEIKNLKSKSDA